MRGRDARRKLNGDVRFRAEPEIPTFLHVLLHREIFGDRIGKVAAKERMDTVNTEGSKIWSDLSE